MEQVYRVKSTQLVEAIKDTLKNINEIEMPKNYDLIKTGHGRVASPDSLDWFYYRMASIVRQAMKNGKLSVEELRHRYGHRKNRGVRPSIATKGSKFVILHAMRELEKIGWFNIKKKEESILTEQARTILVELMEKVSE